MEREFAFTQPDCVRRLPSGTLNAFDLRRIANRGMNRGIVEWYESCQPTEAHAKNDSAHVAGETAT